MAIIELIKIVVNDPPALASNLEFSDENGNSLNSGLSELSGLTLLTVCCNVYTPI